VRRDDIFFGKQIKTKNEAYASSKNFQYLCREGGVQPLDSETPCVWLHRPWPVIIATRYDYTPGACIPYRQYLLFKHDNIFLLENKYNFGAKYFYIIK
jgi:hypothetical protein